MTHTVCCKLYMTYSSFAPTEVALVIVYYFIYFDLPIQHLNTVNFICRQLKDFQLLASPRGWWRCLGRLTVRKSYRFNETNSPLLMCTQGILKIVIWKWNWVYVNFRLYRKPNIRYHIQFVSAMRNTGETEINFSKRQNFQYYSEHTLSLCMAETIHW